MSNTASELVSKIEEQDIYAILCSFLYDLKQVPEYSIISELCYLCDVNSFKKLMVYLGGRTIRIPTKEEFSEVMQTLLLFQYYEVEKRPWKECVLKAGFDSKSGKMAKNRLEKLKQTIENINIGNRTYWGDSLDQEYNCWNV